MGGNRIGGAGVVRLRELEIRVQYDSHWGDYPGPDVYGDELV